MTVLHGNTATGARSNRFGKFMVGTAMVLVGIGAAFGISRLIDDTETGNATVTQSQGFESNLNDKRALEGAAGAAVVSVAPGFDAHIAAKRILEGYPSATVSDAQLKATVAAGNAQLAALNEAGRLQALKEWGRDYGAALESVQPKVMDPWGRVYGSAFTGSTISTLEDELNAIRSGSEPTQPSEPPVKPGGPQ